MGRRRTWVAEQYTDGHNGEGQSSHVPVFCVNF